MLRGESASVVRGTPPPRLRASEHHHAVRFACGDILRQSAANLLVQPFDLDQRNNLSLKEY